VSPHIIDGQDDSWQALMLDLKCSQIKFKKKRDSQKHDQTIGIQLEQETLTLKVQKQKRQQQQQQLQL
jgi:hypothetical protein